MIPKVYILLPVHNRCEVTRRFINCLKAQTFKNYHLILIDDGSDDGTAEMVRENIDSLTVIRGTGNWWWAGSLQHGYQWLKTHKVSLSDLILIINDDTEFKYDFLQIAVNLMMPKHNTLLLAQCYSRQSGRILDSGVKVEWRNLSFKQASKPEEINCLSTRGLFLHVESFYKIGGFYPRMLPHYSSDYEFTIRAYNKGMELTTNDRFRLWLDEEATGYHNYKKMVFKDFIITYFSKRSAGNPIFRTTFIILVCPWRWKIINIFCVWCGSIKLMISKLIFSK
jgi:GT2 family glycosyltransferase